MFILIAALALPFSAYTVGRRHRSGLKTDQQKEGGRVHNDPLRP
jgi:hypothetical protein